MKNFRLLLLGATLIAGLGMSCTKDDNPSLASKTYSMYNYSSGSAVSAGSFTINELGDGNASLSVNLASGFLVPGVTLKSYLIITDTVTSSELTYANLDDIDGATGQETTSPVVNSSTNIAIPYAELISKTGYSVKVLNNTNVQAIGVIH
jgi:hypothetical protein